MGQNLLEYSVNIVLSLPQKTLNCVLETYLFSELTVTKCGVNEDMINLSGLARKLSCHLCNPENYNNQIGGAFNDHRM